MVSIGSGMKRLRGVDEGTAWSDISARLSITKVYEQRIQRLDCGSAGQRVST